ncbi:flagellar basal body P-ring protein FlgI [Simkania negevensis]|uniref:Flagellar basal body P-ring protein FlgI n=1 Tax=Simkania negevensis TaxID=83561 RepID=A0ABS3ARD0_9BACT|nr:flagellar basal body P-ring protein FlgI [Simkania negevensis]
MTTGRFLQVTIAVLLLTPLSVNGEGPLASLLSQENVVQYNEMMKGFIGRPAPGRKVKIRNLVDVVGEESVKLTGFGVVSGLNRTGDSSPAAKKLLLKVAENQGIRIADKELKEKNVALVSISAEVSPHDRRFDVAVKSIGDAKSLQNGFLEGSSLSPLGSDEVYAVASGALALGARYFEAQSAPGAIGGPASVTIGHPTMGYVLDGGELTREIPTERINNGEITFFIKYPDNRTATNISGAINRYMDRFDIHAIPINASTVKLRVSAVFEQEPGLVTNLIADIGALPVNISNRAIITIDQGSGTIAMTEGVKMSPGSIAVAGLTVTVSSDITPVLRQGLFEGETSFIDQPKLEVAEDKASFLSVPAGTDLRKVQETLNALKLTPTSIISVFTAMHKAGMIQADIIIIPR